MLTLRHVLLGLTILFASLVQLWGQSHDAHEHPSDQSSGTQQPASADQRGTQQFPFFVKVIPAPKTEAEAARTPKTAQRKRIPICGSFAGLAL
jgi:hypothetical protein